MISNCFGCIIGTTLFCMVFAETKDPKREHHVKMLFAKMLKNIIKTNEERINALNKLNSLQDYMSPLRTPLRYLDDEMNNVYDDENASNQLGILALLDTLHNSGTLRRIANEKSDSNEDTDDEISLTIADNNDTPYYGIDVPLNDNIEHNKVKSKLLHEENSSDFAKSDVEIGEVIDASTLEDLRRSWRDSCNKKAARQCKKACINAYKNGCRMYACSRRAKKYFKKECRRSCRAKFYSDRYYSDTE